MNTFEIFENTVVILNAPPNAGKDTIADALAKAIGVQHSRFKEHLYRVTAALFNVDLDVFRELATSRATKERPHKDLVLSPDAKHKFILNVMIDLCDPHGENISPREALIYTSEIVIKPNMGEDYFGRVFADNINLANGTVASDGGFVEEIQPCINAVGIENVFIIQFTREGADSFGGDSRDWVYVDDVATLRTTNNGSVKGIVEDIVSFISACRMVKKPLNLPGGMPCQK